MAGDALVGLYGLYKDSVAPSLNTFVDSLFLDPPDNFLATEDFGNLLPCFSEKPLPCSFSPEEIFLCDEFEYSCQYPKRQRAINYLPYSYVMAFNCCDPPPSMLSIPPPRGLMYQRLGMSMRSGWRANGFVSPTKPAFQYLPLPMVPNSTRQNNRGRMNGHMLPQGSGHSVPFMPHLQQSAQSINTPKASSNQQRGGQSENLPNGRSHDINNGPVVPSSASNAVGSAPLGLEMLSSMLAAASPQHQKQILGERLYPFVDKLKLDPTVKIAGMVLEMDGSELLLLLESPESLAAKVDEAVQVLKLSKTKVSGQDDLHPNFISVEVAVN